MAVHEETTRWVDDGHTRVTNRTVRERAMRWVVHFGVIHEAAVDGQWRVIATIDCAHQEVHPHWQPPDDEGELRRSVIRVVRSRSDVDDTYQDAFAAVYDAHASIK